MVIGVITAGGSGRRLGAGVPKFEVEVLGRPLVMYPLETFQRARSVDRLILTLPEQSMERWTAATLRELGITKAIRSIAGGDNRQESVFNALEAIGDDGEIVVVHDGARPLVAVDLIESVVSIPVGADGVIPVVPLADTVKEVESGKVVRTLDRTRLAAVQTPQAFRLEVLSAAYRRARADGFVGTDDSSLVERVGGTVVTVAGRRDNFKVTYPEDLESVEAALLLRREQ